MPFNMQSLLDPSKGFKAAGMAEDVFKQAISRIFAFAYIWGLGGNLAPAARPVFDEHVREQLQDVVNIPGQCWKRSEQSWQQFLQAALSHCPPCELHWQREY